MGNFVKADHLLWCDFETTGLDPRADYVLEVGFVYTDLDLNPLWEFGDLVKGVWPLAERQLNDFTRKMHAENGLIAELQSLHAEMQTSSIDLYDNSLDNLQHKVLAMIPDGDTVALAGSGIAHFDRPFMDAELPELTKRLEYYSIDTGVLRRCLRIFGGDFYDWALPESYEGSEGGAKAHRALADAQAHLAEARVYAHHLRTAALFAQPRIEAEVRAGMNW